MDEAVLQRRMARMASRVTNAFWPNESMPVIWESGGEFEFVALHSFEDGDIWLVRYDTDRKVWQTQRRATQAEIERVLRLASTWLEREQVG